MKRIYILITILLIGISAYAQETPPAGLKAVNSQMYINPIDSSIWHFKGTPYNWERLTRYKDYLKIQSYAGRKVAIIGDSFTQLGIYQDTLKKRLGINIIYNDGIGGSCWTGGSGYIEGDGVFRKPIINRIDAALATNPEILLIEAGSNDFHYNMPLGNVNSRDTTTFYGSIWYGLLRASAKNVRVILVTPTFRTDPQRNGGTSINFTNMIPYVNALKEVGYYLSASVIDAFSCGINGINASIFTVDGVHPNNTAGRFIYANFLANNFNDNPAFSLPVFGTPIYASQGLNMVVSDNTATQSILINNTNSGNRAVSGLKFANDKNTQADIYFTSSTYNNVSLNGVVEKPNRLKIQTHASNTGVELSYKDNLRRIVLDTLGTVVWDSLRVKGRMVTEGIDNYQADYKSAYTVRSKIDKGYADGVYSPIISPIFTGVPTAPTAPAGTSTTQLATTEFVNTALNGTPPVVLTTSITLVLNTQYALNSAGQLSLTLPPTVGFATDGKKTINITASATGGGKIVVPAGYNLRGISGNTHTDGTGYITIGQYQQLLIKPDVAANSYIYQVLSGTVTVY